MSLLDKVGDLLTGGLGKTIVDGIQAYFPPDMPPEQKARLELAIKEQTLQKTQLLHQAAQEERAEFNQRIRDMEGTASDLKRFGWIGSLLIFLRGCQRPVWGYMTLYMDVMWFSGKWSGMTTQQESAMWIVNLLVLFFLFGERGMKNVMPLINRFLSIKRGQS
ncbi:hypothetical protein HMF8227_02364 [Saliniradius amylolyticus]|uniref:Holin of 3TMs, for gene-transfer release n=1 Tax=Saliniradius amylolyticus TaxID=2183582 RepID=A0A2S2E585_9ALTE|nr:hypothetical protein [Saliniradius amylolyticus]AWL12816.1 hypothetical protein HMF8227_02364 [Saliniradius amylolyticus]